MRKLVERFIKRHVVDDIPPELDERPPLLRLPVLMGVMIEPTWYGGQVVKHTLSLRFQLTGGKIYDLVIGSSADGAKMEALAQEARQELGLIE